MSPMPMSRFFASSIQLMIFISRMSFSFLVVAASLRNTGVYLSVSARQLSTKCSTLKRTVEKIAFVLLTPIEGQKF